MLSEHKKEINRRSYAKHLEKRRAEARERRARKTGAQPSTSSYHGYEVFKQRQSEKNALIRAYVVGLYGNMCACCGETTSEFLDLDHVNNDGWAHRGSMKSNSGASICRWAIRHGFPSTLQLLCSSCNQGKRRNNGVCPHKNPPAPITERTASPHAVAALHRFLKSVELGCDPRYGLPGIVGKKRSTKE